MAKTARCEICNTRPQMTAKQRREHGVNLPYCDPCLTEGEWENTHSDWGHDAKSETIVPAGDDENGHRVEGCWICFPELNRASENYTERTGTSRAGMQINVPIRAQGRTKAVVTAAHLLSETEIQGTETALIKIFKSKGITITVTKGTVRLVGSSVELRWDVAGHFVSGTFTQDGKVRKVRNVAEALRLAVE